MSEKFLGHVQVGTNVGKQGEVALLFGQKSAAPHKKMESYVYTSNIYEIIVSQKIIKQKENYKGGRPP